MAGRGIDRPEAFVMLLLYTEAMLAGVRCRAKQLFPKVGCDDMQMLAHVDELLGEYQAKGLYNPGEEEEAGPDADWVDADDEEMEVD